MHIPPPGLLTPVFAKRSQLKSFTTTNPSAQLHVPVVFNKYDLINL